MPVLIQTPQMYFFTQEISDFNKGTILLKNIDGEMSVHRPHLVTEAQRNTLDHVLCITADSLNSDKFLSISPPFVIPELLLFLSQETEFYIDVSEVLQGASGALHNNCASLQSDVNIFWNVDSLIAEGGLHPCSR